MRRELSKDEYLSAVGGDRGTVILDGKVVPNVREVFRRANVVHITTYVTADGFVVCDDGSRVPKVRTEYVAAYRVLWACQTTRDNQAAEACHGKLENHGNRACQ